MKLFTISDLNRGAGVFDYVQSEFADQPSRYAGMSSSVGIGFLAAAFNSGLDKREIDDLIENKVDRKTSTLLMGLREMYSGADRRMHLWNLEKEGCPVMHDYYLRFCVPNWKRGGVDCQ